MAFKKEGVPLVTTFPQFISFCNQFQGKSSWRWLYFKDRTQRVRRFKLDASTAQACISVYNSLNPTDKRSFEILFYKTTPTTVIHAVSQLVVECSDRSNVYE